MDYKINCGLYNTSFSKQDIKQCYQFPQFSFHLLKLKKMTTLNIEWDSSSVSPGGISIENLTISKALLEGAKRGFSVWEFEKEDNILSSEKEDDRA